VPAHLALSRTSLTHLYCVRAAFRTRIDRAISYCEAGLALKPSIPALRSALDTARTRLHQDDERRRLALLCPVCEREGRGSVCTKHKEEKRLRGVCPDCEQSGSGEYCETHLFEKHPEACRGKGFSPLQCKERGCSASVLHAYAYAAQPPHVAGPLERGKASNVRPGMQLLVTERDDRNGGTADARHAQYATVLSVADKGRLTVRLEGGKGGTSGGGGGGSGSKAQGQQGQAAGARYKESTIVGKEDEVEGEEAGEEFWLSGSSRHKPRKKHGLLERLQAYRFVYLLDYGWRDHDLNSDDSGGDGGGGGGG
jgi:hypothetical protein